MRNIQLLFLSIATTLLMSSQALALVDLKLSYGLLASSPTLTDLYSGSITVPSVAPTYGLGVDLVIKPPLFPIGFGARYESMSMSASNSGLEFSSDYTRTALLVNYRLIDTLIYLGPIFTYGLSHSGKIKAVQNGSTYSNFSSTNMSSYSAGIEAGLKLLTFSIGAEAGYEDFRWKGATDSTGTMASRDINMSGSYAKVVFGIGI